MNPFSTLPWFCLVITVFICSSLCQAQQPQRADLAALKLKLKSASGKEAYASVEKAFEQKNIEALLVCLETEASYFFYLLDRNRDAALKVQLAIAILKDEAIWAPISKKVYSKGGNVAIVSLAETVASIASDQLQDKKISAETVMNPDSRRRLVNLLEASNNQATRDPNQGSKK